jgi:hypothetical protein
MFRRKLSWRCCPSTTTNRRPCVTFLHSKRKISSFLVASSCEGFFPACIVMSWQKKSGPCNTRMRVTLTKAEVSQAMGTSLIDGYWNDIVEYRKKGLVALPFRSITNMPFLSRGRQSLDPGQDRGFRSQREPFPRRHQENGGSQDGRTGPALGSSFLL